MILLDAIKHHAEGGRATAAFEGMQGAVSWPEAFAMVTNAVAALRDVYRDGRPVGLALDHSPASALLLVALLEIGRPRDPASTFLLDRAAR